jgi:hypothetical protein
MPMIHRVRVNRLNPDLTETQVFVFRMAGTQDQAEEFGQRLRSHWMRANPGWATTMVTDWPTSQELGGGHVLPDARQLNTAPLPFIE